MGVFSKVVAGTELNSTVDIHSVRGHADSCFVSGCAYSFDCHHYFHPWQRQAEELRLKFPTFVETVLSSAHLAGEK